MLPLFSIEDKQRSSYLISDSVRGNCQFVPSVLSGNGTIVAGFQGRVVDSKVSLGV